MFAKTLVATLILVSTTFALAGYASAGPNQRVSAPTDETSYMDRASKNWDGGGY